MIKFSCHKCGQVIKVSDEYAGKKGKCPKCRTVLLIPVAEKAGAGVAQIVLDHDAGRLVPENRLVRFSCGMCDKVIEANESQRGAILECSGCGSFAEVPAGEKIPEEPEVYENTQEDTGGDEEREYYEYGRTTDLNEVEDTGERKLPWFIDIFLYPINTSGIINLGILIIIPPLLTALSLVLLRVILFLPLAIFLLIFKLIIRAYFFWCIAECVRDSATGGTRAPSAFTGSGDDFWGVVNYYFSLFMCHFLCFGPAILSLLSSRAFDREYWILIGIGCVVYPILFLSIVVIDSISAWNPFMLVASLVRIMPQYLIISAGLFGIIWLAHSLLFWVTQLDISSFALIIRLIKPVFIGFGVYFGFISAHLLGRFYWLNRFRLDWG